MGNCQARQEARYHRRGIRNNYRHVLRQPGNHCQTRKRIHQEIQRIPFKQENLYGLLGRKKVLAQHAENPSGNGR